MVSSAYTLERSNANSTMAHVVELSFPAFDALPALNLRYGTVSAEIDGNNITRALPEFVSTKMQRGAAQDTADFLLNDAKAEIYDTIKPYEDVIEDTRVVVKECLKTNNGIFESEILLDGYIERYQYSESSLGLKISAVSDMSRSGFVVGGRVLSARYCAALFNINGLRAAATDPCGWQIAQGGNATFCTHKMEGTDGCKAHNNPWRFFALEALLTATVTTVLGNIGGGGWDYGGGPRYCFAPKTKIWMYSGEHKPIYKIKKGDIVMSSDLAGNLVPGKVGETVKTLADLFMCVDFGKDRIIEAKAEHGFRIDKNTYKCLGAIDVGEPIVGYGLDGWNKTAFIKDWLVQRRSRMHNFHVPDFGNYFIVTGDKKINVANNKIAPLD